jgi:hypothetical protein
MAAIRAAAFCAACVKALSEYLTPDRRPASFGGGAPLTRFYSELTEYEAAFAKNDS